MAPISSIFQVDNFLLPAICIFKMDLSKEKLFFFILNFLQSEIVFDANAPSRVIKLTHLPKITISKAKKTEICLFILLTQTLKSLPRKHVFLEWKRGFFFKCVAGLTAFFHKMLRNSQQLLEGR